MDDQKKDRFLTLEDLSSVVRLTPLVSIDLVIRDAQDKILVALRNNEPAKGYYFTPGGRVRKNEPIDKAFSRILSTETGLGLGIKDARFIGVFDHIYAENRFGDPSYGTHYVSLGYELKLENAMPVILDNQHSRFKWMDERDLLEASDVHLYTKAFFR